MTIAVFIQQNFGVELVLSCELRILPYLYIEIEFAGEPNMLSRTEMQTSELESVTFGYLNVSPHSGSLRYSYYMACTTRLPKLQARKVTSVGLDSLMKFILKTSLQI